MKDFNTVEEVHQYFHNNTFIYRGHRFDYPSELEEDFKNNPHILARIFEDFFAEIDRIEDFKKNQPPRLWSMIAETGFPLSNFSLTKSEIYNEAKKYESKPLRSPMEIIKEIKKQERNYMENNE